MKYKSIIIIFALSLLFLSFFIPGHALAAAENAPVPETGTKEAVTLPDTCTSNADCPPGYSCWHQLPRGPLPGVPGSPDKPGKCYKDETIKRIY